MPQFLSDPFFYVTLFLGLQFGSFATALAYRLPRDISIFKKARSACTSCGKNLGIADLVPFFSWVFLRGKCRQCKASIGWQYPAIEFSTLLLAVSFYAAMGWGWHMLFLMPLAAVIVAIIAIDFEHKIIPDGLNLTLALLAVAAITGKATVGGKFEWDYFVLIMETDGQRAALGAVIYGGGSWLLRAIAAAILKREPMGLGDIKFFAAAGLWWGTHPDTISAVLILSGLIGTILSILWKKIKKEDEFPFGPSLVLTFLVILLVHPPAFLDWSETPLCAI